MFVINAICVERRILEILWFQDIEGTKTVCTLVVQIQYHDTLWICDSVMTVEAMDETEIDMMVAATAMAGIVVTMIEIFGEIEAIETGITGTTVVGVEIAMLVTPPIAMEEERENTQAVIIAKTSEIETETEWTTEMIGTPAATLEKMLTDFEGLDPLNS